MENIRRNVCIGLAPPLSICFILSTYKKKLEFGPPSGTSGGTAALVQKSAGGSRFIAGGSVLVAEGYNNLSLSLSLSLFLYLSP